MNKLSTALVLAISAILIIGVLVFIFRPIQINRANSNSFHAIVTRVRSGGQKDDIFISFFKQNGGHFISRAIEKGLNVDSLSKKILYKEVTVLYLKPGPLSRLSPIADTRHITELRLGTDTLYSELR